MGPINCAPNPVTPYTFTHMGDTNARTGIGRDFIDNDDKHIPIPPDTFKSRFTRKEYVKTYMIVLVVKNY